MRPTVHIIVFGSSKVGKTCMLRRLLLRKFTPQHQMTIGASFAECPFFFQGQSVNVEIIDLGGSEKTLAYVPSYVLDPGHKCAAVVVYDVTDRNSFRAVRDWTEAARRRLGDKSPIMLCGNKLDLAETKRQISKSEGELLKDELGISLFSEVSALDGTGVTLAFLDVVRRVVADEENMVSIPLYDDEPVATTETRRQQPTGIPRSQTGSPPADNMVVEGCFKPAARMAHECMQCISRWCLWVCDSVSSNKEEEQHQQQQANASVGIL